MRIFFAAAALMAGLCAFSADFDLVRGQEEQTPVVNNSTITVDKCERAKWTSKKDQLKWEPELFFKANKDVTVSTTFTAVSGDWQYCFPTNCSMAPAGTTLNLSGNLVAGNLYNAQIHCTCMTKTNSDTIYGKSETVPAYKATLSASGNGTTIAVTIETVPPTTPTGVEQNVAVTSSLQFVGKAVSYNLKGAEELVIYNANGQVVKNAVIKGNGSLNLDLPQGLYVYSCGLMKGKVLVK